MVESILEQSGEQTGYIDLERRRYNDTVTWLAEVLPGHMRTPFEYRFDGYELYADDGSPLKEIFDDAIQQAVDLPVYEKRRRQIERSEYEEMIAMMRNNSINTMVVVSDFPPELMEAKEDVGGYNVSRKQTMLRVLTKSPAGTLKMYSQSLDLSNRQALEAVYRHLGYEAESGELLGQRMHLSMDNYEQELLVDELTGVYDRSLEKQLGGRWYAGRKDQPPINTYDFARQQQDLLGAYLASTDNFTGGQADYNLAAAITARYQNKRYNPDTAGYHTNNYQTHAIVGHMLAIEEMKGAGTSARQTGITFSGCGATIASKEQNESGLPNSLEQLDEAGYGNKANKLPDDKYGSRYFKCPKGHQNTRWEKNKLIDKCQVCRCSVRCD